MKMPAETMPTPDRLSTHEELHQVLSLLLELDDAEGVEASILRASDAMGITDSEAALAADSDDVDESQVSDMAALAGLGFGRHSRTN